MIPSALSGELQQGLADFLRFSFWSSTPGMETVIDNLIQQPGGVMKGPYVSAKLPFVRGAAGEFFKELPMGFTLHKHQEQAFERLSGRRKLSTLVATGTGSGKTESFLMPILEHCRTQVGTPGIKAIIIYPMNALATDQAKRVAENIHKQDALRGKVRAGLYIGENRPAKGQAKGTRSDGAGGKKTTVMGEDHVITNREAMQKSPPDILLTNYKMLDYLLLRPKDQQIWAHNGAGVLRYLVVDELHTFDGAQGTDLACLIRRLKRRLSADGGDLCCVGTSATLGGDSGGTQLREYAAKVFGESFGDGAVITEQRLQPAEFLEGHDVVDAGDAVARRRSRPWQADTEEDAAEDAGPELPNCTEPGDVESTPPAELMERMDPASPRHQSPEAWLDAQVALWFDGAALPEPTPETPEAPRLALGRWLRLHPVFGWLISTLGNEVRGYDELLARFARRRGTWKDNASLGRLVLGSLLGLVAAALADRGRPEKPNLKSLVELRVQLWQRELRRMVMSVGERPALRFSDDLDFQQRREHLPAVHCRDCSAMGWGTKVDRDTPNVYRTDLQGFYRAFFSRDARVRFLFPAAAAPRNHPEWKGVMRIWLDPVRLTEVPDDEVPASGDASYGHGLTRASADEVVPGEGGQRPVPDPDAPVALVVPPCTESREQTQVLSTDCPFCGAGGSLALVGFQAATLTSVYIDQLFASRFNEDKRLLTFSDSVQDASHRAGFFGARTWMTNLRVALMQTIAASDGLTLRELSSQVSEMWRARMTQAEWVSTFIAPNMLWLQDWEALKRDGRTPRATENQQDLETLIRRRLAFEAVTEFSLQASIGRSLPKSHAAAATIDPEPLAAAVASALEPLLNEAPGMAHVTASQLRAFVLGLLHRLRLRGGVAHPELPTRYVESGGADEYVYAQRVYLPGYGRHARLPELLSDRPVRGRFQSFEGPSASNWYARWVDSCFLEGRALSGDASSTYRTVLPYLERAGLLERFEGNHGESFWGIRDTAVRVTTRTAVVACGECGQPQTVGQDEVPVWLGMPCMTGRCPGTMIKRDVADATTAHDYFARLYARGDVQRIFAEEHTGLLQRDTREQVERGFKAKDAPEDWTPPPREDGKEVSRLEALAEAGLRRPWDPNLLSCTPTLEMGIDIGDLSSVVLCSVPPAQANYLQRIGRAGRRDGNAFVLTVAAGEAHDQYFYADPSEMMNGAVTPPGVFLEAAAVLERQLTAFCFDRWVTLSSTTEPVVIPPRLINLFPHLHDEQSTAFPHGFLGFVDSRRESVLQDFLEMFKGDVAEGAQTHLRRFLFGDPDGEIESMAARALRVLREQAHELKARQADTRRMKKEVDRYKAQEAKPLDYEDQLAEREMEFRALKQLVKGINDRQTLELLTDEGLLPNYAFPESPVTLKSIIWRRNVDGSAGDNKFETRNFEYARAPANALGELAPHAEFFAEGRKVKIDQLDVGTGTPEKWRFCAACSYTANVTLSAEDTDDACPDCGCDMWPGEGQVHHMLKLRMAFARSSDKRTRVRDQQDERKPRFFLRQMLVRMEKGVQVEAYETCADPRTPFGFEYLSRATFREVNFGERSDVGETCHLAGESQVRPGFELCMQCGKVQPRGKQRGKEPEEEHTFGCPSNSSKGPSKIERCLYLYREFSSEAIRMLLPVADGESQRRVQSFLAALQLGLKTTFGGSVDHLRSMVYTHPEPGSPTRRQYLVLFDAVPGGTGYLKQLVGKDPSNPDRQMLFRVLEDALARITSCDCFEDSERDGCYRCLFAYRTARDQDETSGRAAAVLLRDILASAKEVQSVESVSKIAISSMLESALEKDFIEVLRRSARDGSEAKVSLSTMGTGGRDCYLVEVHGVQWRVEMQVDCDAATFGVPSRPDFMLLPVGEKPGAGGSAQAPRRPLAVFTDGWRYHEHCVGEDFAKRMAIQRSGRFDVWNFSWHDLETVLRPKKVKEHKGLLQKRANEIRHGLTKHCRDWRDLPDWSPMEAFLRELRTPHGEQSVWSRVGRKVGEGVVLGLVEPAGEDGASWWTSQVETVAPEAMKPALSAHEPRFRAAKAAAALRRVSVAVVPVPTEKKGRYRFVGMVHLDDRSRPGEDDDKERRRCWQEFLYLFHALRGLPEVWFVTSEGNAGKAVDRLDTLKANWETWAELQFGGGAEKAETWEGEEELMKDMRAVPLVLREARVPVPIVGDEVPDANDSAWCDCELVWPGLKVALAMDDEVDEGEESRRLLAEGWRVFRWSELGEDVQPLIAELRKRENAA